MVVIKERENEEVAAKVAKLTEDFNELKASISELRKHGKDTSSVDLLLLDFPPKAKFARITADDYDIIKLRKLLDEIRAEIEEAKSGSDFMHIMDLIKESYEHLRNNRAKEASVIYPNIMSKYSKLTSDQKKLVYKPCLEIRGRLEKANII